jgi:hypothetical protein
MAAEPEAVRKLRREVRGRYGLEKLSAEEGQEIVTYLDALQAELEILQQLERDIFIHDTAMFLRRNRAEALHDEGLALIGQKNAVFFGRATPDV